MPIGPPYNPLFVGDVPPVPVMPFPPAYPPGLRVPEPMKPSPDPFTKQLLRALLSGSEHTTMDVWMIWVTDGSDPSRTTWVEAAWDDDSISMNREGWDEAVEEAYTLYGGGNVRVTRTSVDFDKVRAAFEPVDV